MASRTSGGGEQHLYLSNGEKRRRLYYVDSNVHISPHRPQRDWPVDYPQLPECDIPCQSVEPGDKDDVNVPDFFVLHEESFLSSDGRQTLTSRSPLLQECRSPSPTPTNWSNGSDLKAHVTDSPSASHDTDAALVPQAQRYEDWRDRKTRHCMTQWQLEILQPLSSNARQLHGDSQLSHSRTRQRDRQAVCGGKATRKYDQANYRRASPENDEHSEKNSARVLVYPNKEHGTHNLAETMMTDAEASASVSAHLANFERRCPSSRHKRILLGLIHPKPAIAEFELDNSALESIFFAANEIFFNGRLTRRVQWDWSDASCNPQYDDKIIGHTSLRRAQRGGFETFILLSTPILRSRDYSRRLLISAFLHELIHCYLFICCGWSARESGGHTDGFRRIAKIIDHWAGHEKLFLCEVEADLERFRQPLERKIGDDEHGQASKQADDYVAYSLVSPVFYNNVCSNTDATWERCVHDRWTSHRGGHDIRTCKWP
ncbi:hypothetical protein SEPCBS119000_005049 [Sporothrix epigloea]|uniref:SprT-like domain-containing protein n=1 Tax=Sporothrix epigloea TaxID=1892477 RepID=A0ABP0DVH4_9PEZI